MSFQTNLTALQGQDGWGCCNVLIIDCLSGNAEEAETVKDGLLESAHLGKARVDMKRARER
jgi:hypothetical protein